jgi:hypothetical protein
MGVPTCGLRLTLVAVRSYRYSPPWGAGLRQFVTTTSIKNVAGAHSWSVSFAEGREGGARFEIQQFQRGASGLKERGLPTGRKHELSGPGRKPT